MKWILAILSILALPTLGANYFVAKTGSDSNDGSSANPWLTGGKAATVVVAGDTVTFRVGDYDEYIQYSGIRVTWQSTNRFLTSVRAFRFDAGSNTLSELTLSKAADLGLSWNSFLYLNDAHWTIVTNCIIKDQPWVLASNWHFNTNNAVTNTISSASVNLTNLGFVAGGAIWVNGASYSNTTPGAQFRFINQQRTLTPLTVGATNMTFAAGALSAETNDNATAVISAGTTFDFKGINFVPSGGSGPTNCIITGVTFSNMVGQAIFLNGRDNLITNCTFRDIVGNSFIVHGGSNHRIVRNLFKGCRLPAYYDADDVVDHTGGTFYDYYVRTVIGSSGQTWNTNTTVEGNWFQDIDNAGLSIQHVVVGDETDFHDYKVIGNVFVGVGGPSDGGQNNMRLETNTFYRDSFQGGYVSFPLTIGGELGVYTNNTLRHVGNMYVSCGNHDSHTNEGYPSFTATTGIVSSNNYVCGREASVWNAMPSWGSTNGVNGGDPMFVNEFDPLGPDGLPFTSDDGLRLHPRSPAIGMGALPVATVASNAPIAFFRPINVASNFLERTGTNFNPNWLTNLYAFQRTNWDRTWDYGDAWMNIPMTVQFSATNSISGVIGTNWYWMQSFTWDFGDGSRPVTKRLWPDISHTFLRTGAVTITLTVTNWYGYTATHTRKYNVLPVSGFTDEIIYVKAGGNDANSGLSEGLAKANLTNGMTRLGPGDYLAVIGITNQWADADTTSSTATVTNGTAAKPITVVGYGSQIGGGRQEVSWWNWEGFEVSGTLATNFAVTAFFTIKDLENGITFRNMLFSNHNFAVELTAIQQNASGFIGGTNHQVLDSEFWRIMGQVNYGLVHFSGSSNILMQGNFDNYSSREADVSKIYGSFYTNRQHFTLNFGYTNNSHSDWMSLGNDSSIPTDHILIEQCWAESNIGTETAIANNGYGDRWLQATNLVVRNCVFRNFMNGMNPIGYNGAKLYNILFDRSPRTNSSTVVQGVNKSSISNAFQNCIFGENYNLGFDASRGWYYQGVGDTNVIGLIANYNHVYGTNYTAKDEAPPHDNFNWASDGLEANSTNGGDPKFTDYSIGLFQPATGSPLIDTGVAVITTGFWGETISGTVDKGPFQRIESAAAVASTPSVSIRDRVGITGRVIIQ